MNRTQKENAIAGKLPNDSKRGRGKDRTIFLTGTIAEVLGQPSYTSVRMSELSNEDIDKLYETLTKKKAYGLPRANATPWDMDDYPTDGEDAADKLNDGTVFVVDRKRATGKSLFRAGIRRVSIPIIHNQTYAICLADATGRWRSALITRRATADIRAQLIKLGATNEGLRDHLRPILSEIGRKTANNYANHTKWHRSRAKKLVIGKFMRLTWSRGAALIEELPAKGKKKLRWYSADFTWLSDSMKSNAFLWQNIDMWSKVAKGDTYDVAVRKLKSAFETATAEVLKKDPELGDVSRHLRQSEDTVYYLHVAPASSDPITVAGKDFTLKVDWNSFGTFSPDSDLQNHDPSYTKLVSTSSAAARKLYKLLSADPDQLRGKTFNDLSGWLTKNKVKWTYQFSSWR